MVFQRYMLNYIDVFNKVDRVCWNYEDGCVVIGAEAMYRATGNKVYFDCIKKYMDRHITPEGTINTYDKMEYNIDNIPSARPLFLLYEQTGEEKYRIAIEKIRDQIKTHPRTKNGNFWHKKIYPYQIWLDGLYMASPFYVMYENKFGDGSNYEDVMLQFRNTRDVLFDSESGLYYHAWDETKSIFWANPETGRSANFWSRSIGWYLMALSDCCAAMPKEKAELKAELAALWKEALDGMIKYQDAETGLFYQLTALKDVEGNYLETSSSAMVAYSIFKGILAGVLDEATYRPIGEAVLLGLATHMMSYNNGSLTIKGMCLGAGLGPADNTRRDGSIRYYLEERVVSNEQKGIGVIMMAMSQWIMLEEQSPSKPERTPEIKIFSGGYVSPKHDK